jgi:hypothetical protein
LIDERSRAGGPNARPIRVLLAKIIARDLFGDGRDPLVDQYNDRLAAVAAERSKGRSTRGTGGYSPPGGSAPRSRGRLAPVGERLREDRRWLGRGLKSAVRKRSLP